MATVLTQPEIQASVKQTKILIDNKFVDSISGKTFETVNPATGDVLAHVAEADSADVDLAVKAARKAFHTKSAWRRMAAAERGHAGFRQSSRRRRQAYGAGLAL